MNIAFLLNPAAEDNDHQQQQPATQHDDHQQRAEESRAILQLITCLLCGQLLSEPITLRCGNTYCRACLTGNNSSQPFAAPSELQFSCPSNVACRWSPHTLGDPKNDVILLTVVSLCERELGAFEVFASDQRTLQTTSSRLVPHGGEGEGRVYRFINMSSDGQGGSEEDEDEDEDENDDDDDYEDEDEEDDEDEDEYEGEDDDEDEDEDEDEDNDYSTPVWRTSRSPVTVPSREHVNKLKESILREVECQVCTEILIDPTTTPCGHTYCRTCLTRTLDHQNQCPLCRRQLSYAFFQNHPRNEAIHNLIITLYPQLHHDRQTALAAELHSHTQDTPLFVGQLTFPNMPCFVDVHEAHYRLMLRRCLDSRQRQFGMLLPSPNSPSGYCQYGTMLEIRSTEFLTDGRTLVETVGTYRFKVIQDWMNDGYHMGRIERIDDIDPAEEARLEHQAIAHAQANNGDPNNPNVDAYTIAELVRIAQDFIESLRNCSAPWLLPRLNSTYGEMPEDPSNFSFWVATVMPVDEKQKYNLLALRSVRARLKLIVQWISQVRNQWWVERGCIIS